MYEIFMDIPGYEGLYQSSNLGRIRNSNGLIMKQRKDKNGYMIINLCKDGKRKTYPVHKLVILAFKANPENKLQVNHINEIKTDNRLNNLEWSTPKENCNHGTKIERTSNANKIKVKCIELDKVFDSAKDAALWLSKINGGSSITACCKGKQKIAYGYTWKYVNPRKQITVTNKPVFNITTNTKYANAVEAVNAYGRTRTNYLYKACRHGNTYQNCQWCFYQEDMEFWDTSEFIDIWD